MGGGAREVVQPLSSSVPTTRLDEVPSGLARARSSLARRLGWRPSAVWWTPSHPVTVRDEAGLLTPQPVSGGPRQCPQTIPTLASLAQDPHPGGTLCSTSGSST